MTVTMTRSPLRPILIIAGYAALLLFAVLQITPFLLTAANSFKCLPAVQEFPQAFIPVPPMGVACRSAEGIALPADATASMLTFNPTWEAYGRVFEFNLPRWFVNSVIFAVGVTLLRVIFDSMAGYALARLNFNGSRFVFFVILGTMMIPAIVLIIPRVIILQQLGLLNTYQGVLIPLAVDAFGIFLMKQFFESLPGEIIEAAKVDGAGQWSIFTRVALPMAVPGLVTLTIFSFLAIWNNFIDLLIIVGGDKDLLNLPLGLALLRGQFGETLEWNIFLAGAMITTLPMALLFFFFQRYFVEGVSYTGVKG